MKFELHYTDKSERMLYWMSPTEIKELLKQTLNDDNPQRNPLWHRQVSGCLNRVPADFYSCMYKLVERSPGIRFQNSILEVSLFLNLQRKFFLIFFSEDSDENHLIDN